jgi:CDP-diacylglycerol---glycerol-3-phosphate 3-phosphatidyltransferase
MNVPNQLTVSRFILAIAFVIVMVAQFPYHETLALLLFGTAGITDYFDGKIARRDKLITNFGILMDPLADKILVCSAFIAFVERGWTPAWMAIIVVARELVITGLRLLAASKNVVLAAERYGKHKTISQIVAILAILLLASYPNWGALGQTVFGFQVMGYSWIGVVARVSLWAAVLLTLYSGAMYLWRNREIYMRDM